MIESVDKTHYYNVSRAAQEAGVSPQTIINNIKKGKLKAAITGVGSDGSPKKYRISSDDLDTWLESRPTAANSDRAKIRIKKKYSDMELKDFSDHVGGWILDAVTGAYNEGYNKGLEDGKEAMRKQIMGAIKEEK